MAGAVTAAAGDAGAPSLLAAVQQVSVPRGTWSYTDPGRLVARAIGAPAARTVLAEIGVPQQTLVNDALRGILAGELDVAVVVGGEAKRSAAIAAAGGTAVAEVPQQGDTPDEHLISSGELMARAEVKAGLFLPVLQYAMIDNALRHAEGTSIAGHRDEIAQLWSGFNAVAQDNPDAAFPQRRSAAFLREPAAGNRPLAFPYAKWHSTQWTVDQAAALLLCSAGAAEAHGVPPDRWVFPRVALESSYLLSLSRRRDLHRWPAMNLLGQAAADRIGRPLAEVETVEVYSCFPAAVRVQQRELGLPLDAVPTVTGGMAFAGGPLNNFTYQATAAVVARLRAAPGTLGLVTTVSGLLTKPGVMVWANEPEDRPPLVADLAAEAAAATETAEVVDDYTGPASVVTYTVTYDGLVPRRTLVIAGTPDGRRCVASNDDLDVAAQATSEELIGAAIDVAGGAFVPG
jgi:acetyl-CoA C-acetyltransferase